MVVFEKEGKHLCGSSHQGPLDGVFHDLLSLSVQKTNEGSLDFINGRGLDFPCFVLNLIFIDEGLVGAVVGAVGLGDDIFTLGDVEVVHIVVQNNYL